MSEYINVFKRKEIKYLLDSEKFEQLFSYLNTIALVDRYGKTRINNIYFDTKDYKLIQTSLEKPIYKEKIRLRTYGNTDDYTDSFIELKKKYKGIVYKRRISAPYTEAYDYLVKHKPMTKDNQIYKEIDSFVQMYPDLKPAMKITYDRVAMYGIDDPSLRITFDSNIKWSVDEIDLKSKNDGRSIIEEGKYMMEIKVTNAFPLELARKLSELQIYPTSFSKYGRGYMDMTKRNYRYCIAQGNEENVKALERGVIAYV